MMGGGAEAPAINMATFYKLNGLMITLQASWAYFYMPKEVCLHSAAAVPGTILLLSKNMVDGSDGTLFWHS